ncbi:proprotein convertase P-domain-containing protein [Agrilutibacter solisilvae]|uniref:Proprotein convertase P-domain-containing protein n=1 Tax=Agrilutibacter solisilvae TaxID=2763317 RepID=A0A974Y298_9GAMM|nr:proprotein convertase P-domain-containing protein [Lysobacter solisilvae]QSX79265.1 proprotein convertase P-domain-containing protein [Lysobacter solisilvae]
MNRVKPLTLLSVAVLMALPALAHAGLLPRPIRAADTRTVDIRLDGRIAGDVRAHAAPVRIATPDAAFIKVEFEHFHLPRGVTLEVSNPAGTEVYRYSSSARDGFTVDRKAGQNGTTRFSAMSITGNTALLRLVGTAQEPWTSAHGVRISRYQEGIPEALMPQLAHEGLLDPGAGTMSLCGTDDKKPAVCYAGTDAAAYDRSRPVARMVTPAGYCTAWRVGPTNRMFTNNHCAAVASDISGSEFWFNYQVTTCTGSTQATVVKVPGDVLLKTDANLDYTLFTVKNFDTIASFGYYGLDPRAPQLNEEIFIAGHPGGRMKELAIVSDQDGGGRCRVNDTQTTGNGGNVDMGYYCDTEGGNSGSPVLARSSNKVLALHHLGGCLNEGARMELIWPQVATHFGNQVPDGDTGGGNAAPVANFTYTVSARTASFTDASSDSDGTIASRSWNFGDGTTSTATSPSKTYSADGSYTVTLTVTDDDGATHTKSQAVVIGTSDTVLANGVAKTNLSAAAGASLNYTMVVPAGTTNLAFTTSGGTGDADLYVKLGSAPTDSSYDCRPYKSGNAETCTFATPAAGTYYVRVKAFSAFSGLSLVGSFGSAPPPLTNATNVNITDNATVESPITASGLSGNASASAKVAVDIKHTYIGDLKVDLVAPDGTVYTLHNRAGGSADNINQTFTVNLSSELKNGTWKLRVNDNAGGDTGYIDSWSLTL